MAPDREAGFALLPRQAQAFICATIAASAVLTTVAVVAWADTPVDVPLLLCAAALCAGANLFEVFAPGHYSLQPNFAFFFCGAVLLPPWATALLAICCFLPSLVAKRLPWFKVAFNVANYMLSGLTAYAIVTAGDAFGAAQTSDMVIVLAAAAAAYALVNHLLIALVATYASRGSLRGSLHQLADGLPPDLALAATGACLAVLWESGPAAALLALGPIALIHRALLVPQLEHRVRTDPKTGLYNFVHFGERLDEELADAGRRGGSLAVVVVDLDHLREINNRFGHLVGDRVIRAVADAIGDVGEPNAIAARFGGEEFCLLLPGASAEDAQRCAERVRRHVEALRFRQDDELRPGAPAEVTLSAGVAVFPDHGETPEDLLKAADLAMYEAKAAGRNRVRVGISSESRAVLDLRDEPFHAPLAVVDAPAGPPDGVDRRRQPEPPVEPPEEPHIELAPQPTPEATAPVVGTRKLLPAYAAAIGAAAVAVAGLTGLNTLGHSPELLVFLVLSVIVLDFVDLDLFGRGRVSPGAIPSLALAFTFGPAGPVAAEALVLVVRLARREPLTKAVFNFGSLGLSGAAAAGVFAVSPLEGTAAMIEAGTFAGLAYYAVNATLVAIAWGLDEGVSPVAAWRERFAWCWPYHLVFGALAGTLLVAYDEVGNLAFGLIGLPVAMLWLAQKQYLDRTRANVTELRERAEETTEANRRLTRLLEDKHELLRKVHKSYLATITSLARTIEAKDPHTGGHTERVAEMALLLADELGFDETEQRAVGVGAVIHDIGKVGIPDDILLKPGILSEEELEVIQRQDRKSTRLNSSHLGISYAVF